MFKTLSFSLIAALALGATNVTAKTLVAEYDATSAVSTSSSSDHSMWLSMGVSNSIGSDFDFVPAGEFRLYDDNSGTLTGTLVSQSNADAKFEATFNFSDAGSLTPAAVFKPEQGSAFNPLDGFFLNMTGGTLRGLENSLLDGLDIDVALMRGPGNDFAVQLGSGITPNSTGANNKNPNFGMAYWFQSQVLSADCIACDQSTFGRINNRQGDINVNLEPVPLPASGLLVIAGLSALGAMRRRKHA